MQRISFAERKQSKKSTLLQRVYKVKQKKNVDPAFWNPTSRQTDIYTHTCLCGSWRKIHKIIHVHTFWKPADARQSL